MKRFTLEQSSDEIYTDCSGLALVGLCINRYSNLSGVISRVSENDNKLIPDTDLFRSYLGLLCTGKSDYEAVTPMREDSYFQEALGIKQVPSAETLRQRFDQDADMLRDVAQKCSIKMLKNVKVPITPLGTGHIPLDIDVFPMDNSGTKKEHVGRTYKGCDGYAPIAAYLGMEGWCLETELRPGTQHSQEDFLPFLKRVIDQARILTGKKLLVRLDSAHDAVDNLADLRYRAEVSSIIKWNPRREDTKPLCRRAFKEGVVTESRKGKRVALLKTRKRRDHNGRRRYFTRVIRVIERTIDKYGQFLLEPDIKIEGWWTDLNFSPEKIIALYENHGLSEQFHSEFKTDLDLERLPSGKFATNALVMTLGVFSYNILKVIGQFGLLGKNAPIRHPAKRRRIKTVLQELIYVAARMIRTGNRIKLRFSCHCPVYPSFVGLYNRLSGVF